MWDKKGETKDSEVMQVRPQQQRYYLKYSQKRFYLPLVFLLS